MLFICTLFVDVFLTMKAIMKHVNFLYVAVSLLCATTSLNGAMLKSDQPSKNASIHKICAICQGSGKDRLEFAFLLPCGHMFHKACFREFIIDGENTCPTCGSSFIDRGISLPYPFDQYELESICKSSLLEGYPGITDSVLRMGILDKVGLSHLLHAVAFYFGDCELATKLITAGADVDHQREVSGATSLCEAVFTRKQAIVEVLLKAGANPNIACRSDGCTPLDYARYKDYWDIAKLLLDAGARHANYTSYISWAVKKNSFEILKALLKANIPLNNENFVDLWEEHCKIAESNRDGRIGAFILQRIDPPKK
jgi:hypothetical protein